MQNAVSKQGVVDALVSLVASQNVETQVLSVRCLARFAAWTDSPRHAYCTADVAEVTKLAILLHGVCYLS